MKYLLFLTLFILILGYATQAHSVLAVHDEWVENEEVKFEFSTQKLQEPIVTMPDGYNNEVVYFHKPNVTLYEEMIFDGNYYCAMEVSKLGNDWKLEMKLCEEE